MDPAAGHGAPKLTWGWNGWRVAGGAGLEMSLCAETEVRAWLCSRLQRFACWLHLDHACLHRPPQKAGKPPRSDRKSQVHAAVEGQACAHILRRPPKRPLAPETYTLQPRFTNSHQPQATPSELWWEVALEAPAQAACLNFCVVAGDNAWDNNGGADHKVCLILCVDHLILYADSSG